MITGTQTPPAVRVPACSEERRQIEPAEAHTRMILVYFETSEIMMFLPLSFFAPGEYNLQ